MRTQTPTLNLKQKGNEYYKQGQYAMATAMYKKYVTKNHFDNKNAYYNMALCFYKLDKYDQCIECCKQALRIDPNYLKVYFRLALAFDKSGNDSQTFANAVEFIQRSDEISSPDYVEMKELCAKIRNKIMYPIPIQIQEKNKIFFPKVQNKHNKIQTQNPQYFPGYTWLDVQNSLDDGNPKLALDRAYGLTLHPCRVKDKTLNQQNLRTVMDIRFNKLPKDTRIVTDITALQKIMKTNLSQKSDQKTENESISQATRQEVNQKQVKQKSDDDYFNEYFLHPLQRKLDIFEGFPNVVIEITKNPNLTIQNMQKILSKANKEYPMFMALQISLTQAQKKEIKSYLIKKKLSFELIDIYCS